MKTNLSPKRRQMFLFSFSVGYLILLYLCNRYFPPLGKEQIPKKDNDSKDSQIVTSFHPYMIPDIIHFIRFGNSELKFFEVIAIKAVYLNHRPESIIIHCDCHSLTGKYWDMIKDIPILQVKFMEKPTHVLGYRLSGDIHSRNVAKIQVLMHHGGIYVDSESYVVKSLNKYRKFESSVGWSPRLCLGTQVITASQNAMFLKLWLNSYHAYEHVKCYYPNTVLPTDLVTEHQPDLVPRFPYDFDVQYLNDMLYESYTDEWKNYDVIPLSISRNTNNTANSREYEFNEENIKNYNKTFGDMARLVLYGTERYTESNESS